MFRLIVIFIATLSLNACVIVAKSDNNNESVNTDNIYNAELAKELGADDYGMRSYVFVILKTGPNDASITDEEKRANLFAGHFSNMSRLAEEGKLLLAGPLGGEYQRRGIFVFDVPTIEQAQALVATDPTIEAGIFEV